MKTSDRVWYLDYLRIIATIAVVVLHVAASQMREVAVSSYAFMVYNAVDSAVRWAVPVFVMISGALFLQPARPLSVKTLYTRTILRMVTAFAVWSAVYALDGWMQGDSLTKTLSAFIEGHYHMWYLYMIVALYAIVPLLRLITAHRRATEYFLLLGLLFTFLLPSGLQFLEALDLPYVGGAVHSIGLAVEDMDFHLALGYPVYFVLGYYLSAYDIPRRWRRLAYGLVPVGYLITVVMTAWFSRRAEELNTAFYSNFSLNVLLMAAGLFLLAKHGLSRITLGDTARRWVIGMSACTFGVYLVHPLLITLCERWLGLTTQSFEPLLSIPVITVLVTVVAVGIAWLLGRIPGLRKYVV